MPVITRSQISYSAPQKADVIMVSDTKLSKEDEFECASVSTLSWFVKTIKKYLINIDISNNQRVFYKELRLSGKIREEHFEQVRLITEMFNILNTYFVPVHNRTSLLQLAKAMYSKIQELYQEIHNHEISPKTDEERHIIRTLLIELQNAEAMVITYLPEKQIRTRRFAPVDYSGMDTLDDEYDEIADIWKDTQDSDYYLTVQDYQQELEDSLDDELYDTYVVYDEDSKEDEEEQYDSEDEEEQYDSDYKEEQDDSEDEEEQDDSDDSEDEEEQDDSEDKSEDEEEQDDDSEDDDSEDDDSEDDDSEDDDSEDDDSEDEEDEWDEVILKGVLYYINPDKTRWIKSDDMCPHPRAYYPGIENDFDYEDLEPIWT